ncbi:MAG: XrtA/PEP-CTERM system amidotransferase [Pseudomonadota bacterium]
MCGIAGILDLKGRREIDRNRLAAMTNALAHRGPDGEGFFIEPGIGLGHRRLSIIDLEGGAQPFHAADGNSVLTFNGEIYNYQDLRAGLTAKGVALKTQSDTEALIESWSLKGSACLEGLVGMYAFAVWDKARETLVLARDRLGEKPIYYMTDAEGFFLFASEIGALLAAVSEMPPLNPEAVADYFAYGYVPDPKSIYQGIFKLPPACKLKAARGAGVEAPEDYWRLRFGDSVAAQGEALHEEMIDRLQAAVSAQLVSDVPLGAFLSGGVDSSAIVALMSRSGGSRPVTCSMGFKEGRFNETQHARLVADRYKTQHFEEDVTVDAVDLIDRLAGVYGEPFADNSALPTYLLCGVAKRHVTVALSGDGADELLAGYRRYAFHVKEETVKSMLPAGVRRPMFGALARIYPKLDWAPQMFRAKATFEALATDAAGGYMRAMSATPDKPRAALLSGEAAESLNGYAPANVLAGHMAAADTDNALSRIQYADMKTWLAGRMLVKVDRASMAHSLEVRPPFLDHRFVEWAAQLPQKAKLDGFEGKAALKAALADDYLPREILYRPKQGFYSPVIDWLRGDLAGRTAALAQSTRLKDTGLINLPAVKRMAAEHKSGAKDHHMTLWALLMFDAFLGQAKAGGEQARNAA